MHYRESIESVKREERGGKFTVASLHVKVAKVVNFMPILQIMQIGKSTRCVESEG
jgi:hypothetical protein